MAIGGGKFSLGIHILIALLSWYIPSCLSAQGIKKLTYPVVIAFTSNGSRLGDHQPVVDFIKRFKKKYKIKEICSDRIGPFGREGAYDLCFSLKELSKKQKQLFSEGMVHLINALPKGSLISCILDFSFGNLIKSSMIHELVL